MHFFVHANMSTLELNASGYYRLLSPRVLIAMAFKAGDQPLKEALCQIQSDFWLHFYFQKLMS